MPSSSLEKRTATQDLKQSLMVQARVVSALILREILTRYGRKNIGFLWLFIEPILFTLGIVIIRNIILGHAPLNLSSNQQFFGNMSFAGFLVTGYSGFILFRNICNRLSSTAASNRGLLYHRNIRILDLIFSRFILELAAVSASLLVLTLVFNEFGLMSLPLSILDVIFAWLLLAWFCFGFGLIVGYMMEASSFFDRIWPIVLIVSLPFSGVIFMLSWLPTSAQEFLSWFPLVNALEYLRESYFGTSIKAMYSISYLVAINLILTLVGLSLARKIRRVLESE
jgi:capsular polysaccharide transport system permease protein